MKWLAPILIVLWCAAPVRAQVTFDNSASAVCASCSSLTYSLTVGSGANRQLAVLTSVGCRSGETAPLATGVTYDGVALTRIQRSNPIAARFLDLWALPAGTQPNSGAHNVVVTLASSISACNSTTRLTSGAIAVAGVDQSTTFTSSNNNAGTSGTSATLTLSSSGATDLGVDGACAGSTFSSTTETSRWNAGDGQTSCNAYGGATAAGGDTSLSWTISGSDSWLIVGGAFKAAGGAASNAGFDKARKLEKFGVFDP